MSKSIKAIILSSKIKNDKKYEKQIKALLNLPEPEINENSLIYISLKAFDNSERSLDSYDDLLKENSEHIAEKLEENKASFQNIAFFLDLLDENEVMSIVYLWFFLAKQHIVSKAKAPVPYIGYLRPPKDNMLDFVRIDFEYMFQILQNMTLDFEYPTLLVGPTGSGKTSFATFISRNFMGKGILVQNLAAIQHNSFEITLHGVKKEFYTGVAESEGVYHTANANEKTLLLDELEGLNKYQQIKMLNDIGSGKYIKRCKVGTQNEELFSIPIIFATNANFRQMVLDGKLREDFLYRIPQIVEFDGVKKIVGYNPETLLIYILFFSMKNRQSLEEYFDSPNNKSKYFFNLDPEMYSQNSENIKKLLEYDWPGNFRQIENFSRYLIRRFDFKSETDKFSFRDETGNALTWLDSYNFLISEDSTEDDDSISMNVPRKEAIEGMELNLKKQYKKMFETALKITDNNKTQAAKKLGISTRTLNKKLKEFGLMGNA